MNKLIIVCGQTGAGKTTHATKICAELNAIKFSIDPWMQTLFSKDMKSLDFSWMMERVERCQEQIWEVAMQILNNGGSVVLDLGFTTKSQRQLFVQKAHQLKIQSEVHYIEASTENRQKRVKKRNDEKDPAVYSFEVTDQMFTFMEPRFEYPDEDELRGGKKISV
jgi:predicted kinase